MRLFERLVNDRLVDHCDSNFFFTDHQAGFRRGLSTYDNIYRLLRDVYTQLRKRGQLPVIFLDIVKAFDRVPHPHLLHKIHVDAGITGKAWGWLRAFLSNRLFRVRQGHDSSDWFPATAGVPQGCVLSPLLFAIYINDIVDLLEVILALFADDGAGWPAPRRGIRPSSQYARLHELLAHIDEWSARWGLDFSVDKSQWILFTNKLSPSLPSRSLCLRGENELEQVDYYKYLGLTFQSDGKWHAQFNAIAAKAKNTANLISRICSRNSPPDPITVANLVKYILIPQISYGFAFWRPNKSQIKALTQIIATPLRFALSLHRSASAIRVLWEFAIPTASSLRLRCFLQSISRAMRSALAADRYLPSLLQDDFKDVESHDASKKSSSKYCRSLKAELDEIQAIFPLATRLPLIKKHIDSICKASMRREWRTLSTAKGRAVKPVLDRPRYISVDPKPIVGIRARLRLGSALTPKRRFIYGLAVNNKCECGRVGDTDHILLHCKRLTKERLVCTNHLLALSPSVVLEILFWVCRLHYHPILSIHITRHLSNNTMNNAYITLENSLKRLIVVFIYDCAIFL